MKSMSISKSLSILCLLSLSACTTTDQNVVTISGSEYQLENGKLVISKAELDAKIKNGQLMFVNHSMAAPHIELSEKEFSAIQKNEDVLFEMLGVERGSGEVIALIRPGSLFENLTRISQEQSWGNVSFDGDDLFVDRPYVIRGDTFEQVISDLLKPYDAFACFEQSNFNFTVIKL